LELTSAAKGFLSMFSVYMFFNHMMACIWYLQAKLQDFPDDSWVMRSDNQETKENKLYLISFYWAYQTLTTVGFGDYNGNGNSIEKIIACVWMILGVLVSSYMIGNFISLIQINEQANTII